MEKKMMKAAVMTELGKVEITEREVPEIQEDEVLIKIDYVGICGSDLHYFEHGRIGDYIVKYPFVLGHEVGGTVIRTGSAVSDLRVHDRVALEPQITCGECEYCKAGKYNLCRDVRFFATPPVDGVFQEYVAHPARLCFKLPENVSTEEGALIEPLSVGFHAAMQGEAKLGQTCAVTGTGCIGLTGLLSVKACGASETIVTDLFEKRLAKAKELGADHVINSRESDPVDEILRLTDGKGFDLAIETSGSEIAAGQLIRAAKPGATIVFVGYSRSGMMNLPISAALDKEITFKTIFRYRNSYAKAIAAVAGKQIDVKSIVSHRYRFDQISQALNDAIEHKDEVIKAVIQVSDDAI